MDENIEWKEARGGQSYSDSEDEIETKTEHSNEGDWAEDSDEKLDDCYQRKERAREHEERTKDPETNDGTTVNLMETNLDPAMEFVHQSRFPSEASQTKIFSHQQINLILRRNITALADTNQHKPKPTYASDNQFEPFDLWLENALVASSPNADLLLFSSQSPEPITFIAKLRMEPINQYVTKPLEIPLDYNDQVTSLLCLPIMSTQKTSLGSVDWTVLVIGLSSGYVKFYTEKSICLLSLKFCDEPAISLKCQTLKYNSNARSETHFATIPDELLVTYRTLAVVIDGLSLHENLRISKEDVIRNGSNYEPAYNLTNLPSILNCQKWKIEYAKNSLVMGVDLLGVRRTTTFDQLRIDSTNFEQIQTKACATTLAIVGKTPFVSTYRESKETNSHTYTEMIGSIFSLWNKPQPTRAQLSEVSNFSSLSLFDKGRLATSIISSPDKRLAAVTDDFGRVLLVDVTNWLIVRIWKGYRSAQCGWIEVKRDPEKRGCPYASFLVIYAPKRGLLEVWLAQRGPRVAAFNVGKSCRLLYSGYKMLNMRADQLRNGNGNLLTERSYSSHCYLLSPKSETVFSVELPYTYSLYKYSDLKSRDHLLIGELVNAIQQDSEVGLISEILNRIALAESIEASIQKVAHFLNPEKTVALMENLVIKTMKNYDNHAGETLTDDDMSIIELCKRLIRLCSVFKDLSTNIPHDLSLPDVNQRLIEQYEEHPQEIDEFSEQLGWSATETLRYLSLLSLERSYRKNHLSNPWPNLGEPLAWTEFISCFDLSRIDNRKKSKKNFKNPENLSIQLQEFNSNFLNRDKVVKTALFMYHRLSENYYRFSHSTTKQSIPEITNNYNYFDPPSRLALLFQFWLSTKLCNHWKMWAFLQNQVGQISDELKVMAMAQEDDNILLEAWKPIYNLILESDNIYAAIIATATIRSDTVKTIHDNEKREKLEKQHDTEYERRSSIDWECLCIDAERMSILSQQLEDVFLVNLLLRYSISDGHSIESYLYRLHRISVANILRGGPTIVSELVAQWAVQSRVNPKLFTHPYGGQPADDSVVISGPSTIGHRQRSFARISISRELNFDSEEHAKELLHHVKTSYPCSLEPDIVLLNCIWELCSRWTTTNLVTPEDKLELLRRTYDCLSLLSTYELRHKSANVAYKTFFQRTFERIVILIETNSTLLSVKSARHRDSITRKELDMGEENLEGFVQFCCDISEFLLQTCGEYKKSAQQDDDNGLELKERLLVFDEWWATPTVVKMLDNANARPTSQHSLDSGSSCEDSSTNSLIMTTLFTSNLINIDVLVELNRLANLMNLIFKLKIVKAYPISLIGEESRQILQFDLQQSPTGQAEMKTRTGSVNILRQKFARKCIVGVVAKLADETNEFSEDEFDHEPDEGKQLPSDIERKTKSTQQVNIGRAANSGLFLDDDDSNMFLKDENNESMILFANLLSLANEWKLNCDELYLELVFELYRCNLDKIASQISTRVSDQQTLANGLLKISSQRVLVLFGLSPQISGPNWRRRSDKWSIFQPNVASWLKSIQQEEMRREIACLSFSDSLKPSNLVLSDGEENESSSITFGLQAYVLNALRRRTKLVLENVTNHLDGQGGRLAYDLLQLLESQLFDKFTQDELLSEKVRVSR